MAQVARMGQRWHERREIELNRKMSEERKAAALAEIDKKWAKRDAARDARVRRDHNAALNIKRAGMACCQRDSKTAQAAILSTANRIERAANG